MIKRIPTYYIKLILFWLLFFAFTKLFFLVFNGYILHLNTYDFFEEYIVSIQKSLYTIIYILFIPWITLSIQSIYPFKFLNIINKLYQNFMIIIIGTLSLTDTIIYNIYQQKMTFDLFFKFFKSNHFLKMDTLLFSVSSFIVFIIFMALYIIIFNKYVFEKIQWERKNIFISILFIVSVPFINYCLISKQTSKLFSVEKKSNDKLEKIIQNIIGFHNIKK